MATRSKASKVKLFACVFDNPKNEVGQPTESEIKEIIPEVIRTKGQRLSLAVDCRALSIPHSGTRVIVYRISDKHITEGLPKLCIPLPEQNFKSVTAQVNDMYADDLPVLEKMSGKCGLRISGENQISVSGYLFQIQYLNQLMTEENLTNGSENQVGVEQGTPTNDRPDSVPNSEDETRTSSNASELSESEESNSRKHEVKENLIVSMSRKSSNQSMNMSMNITTTQVRPSDKLDQSVGRETESNPGNLETDNEDPLSRPGQSIGKSMTRRDGQQKTDSHTAASGKGMDLTNYTNGEGAQTSEMRRSVNHNNPSEKQTQGSGTTLSFGLYTYLNKEVTDGTKGLTLKRNGKEYEVFGNISIRKTFLDGMTDVKIEARKSHLTAADFKNTCAKLSQLEYTSKQVGLYLDDTLMNAHMAGPKDKVNTLIVDAYNRLKVPLPREYRNRIRKNSRDEVASGCDSNSSSVRSQEEGPPKEKEKCPICLDDLDTTAKVLPDCKHSFCKDCIDQAFDVKPVCPTCGKLYGQLTGTQPKDGCINVDTTYSHRLPGYESYGIITINYSFPDGYQGSEHPDPGKWYKGIKRTAYLPNNQEGKKVARLLKEAFEARIVFTIGRSTTTGKEGKITWNDIHHKTNMYGGTQKFGYPDPKYLTRVQEELAAKGFK